MLKIQVAAVAAAFVAIASVSATSASAAAPCVRCADAAAARATTVQVRTVYRTQYVNQVREVTRVRNVYRDRVVHAQPRRTSHQPRYNHPRYNVAYRGHRPEVIHFAARHPNWVPMGVTPYRVGHVYYVGYYRQPQAHHHYTRHHGHHSDYAYYAQRGHYGHHGAWARR